MLDAGADADEDGFSDGIEVKRWNISPLAVDSDGNFLRDCAEIASIDKGSNPTVLDVQLVPQMVFDILPAHPGLDIDRDGNVTLIDLQLGAQAALVPRFCSV